MSLNHKSLLATALIALAAVMCVTAQDSRPKFEVTSIKPAPAGAQTMRLSSSGGRFFSENLPLRTLLENAYRPSDGSPLLNNMIIGAPSWIDTDRYDVEAAAADAKPGPIPQLELQPMLRALLEDRLKLRAHQETRELPVYDLVLAKGTPHLKRSEDQSAPDLSQISNVPYDLKISPPRGMTQVIPDPASGSFVLSGTAITISKLATNLTLYAGRRVVDQTHLEGLFDVRLVFDPNVAPQPNAGVNGDSSVPSIFTALQEQLGLKLESARGRVEVLVIDSVTKPTEN